MRKSYTPKIKVCIGLPKNAKNMKTIITLSLILLLSVSACNKEVSNKNENATPLATAAQEQIEAEIDAQADYEALKMKISEQVSRNEVAIASFRNALSVEAKRSKMSILENISRLEAKNNKLKKQLSELSNSEVQSWESVKISIESSSAAVQQEFDALQSGKIE